MWKRRIARPVPEVEQIDQVGDFFKEWEIYQKVEENDYLSHREVYALLHRFLLAHCPHASVFLDLGCGDAEFVPKALEGTAIRRYVGVDFSKQVLELAQEHLTPLQCAHQLVEQDFYEFVREAKTRADVIWMGLTFHHLPLAQKATFLHLARRILPENGYLLMYEPVLLEDETRDQFLERSWQNLNRVWLAMSPEELQKIQTHVSQCDFPEKFSLLSRLGQEHGFSGVKQLFQDPAKLFSLIGFQA